MEKQLLQVAAFMRMTQQIVRLTPSEFIPVEEFKLRRKLTDEESGEFFDEGFIPVSKGQSNQDMVVNLPKALDGLADRLYVLLGDAHAVGLGFLLPVAFRMVHESNMTKLWTDKEVEWAKQTETNLTFTAVLPVEKRGPNIRGWVAHNQIGKAMKSPSYEAVDFAAFFDDLAGQTLLDFNSAQQLVFGDAPERTVDELMEEFGKDSEEEKD